MTKLERQNQIRERVAFVWVLILVMAIGITIGMLSVVACSDDVSACETASVDSLGLYAGFTDAMLNIDLTETIVENEVEEVAEPYEVDGVAVDCGYTYEDLYCLANVMMAEGGTVCSSEVLLDIGSVVVNRMADHDFPSTIQDVVYQRGQYSTSWNGAMEKYPPTDEILELACEILNTYYSTGETYLPAGVVYQSNYPQNDKIYLHTEGLYFCYK